MYHKKENVPAGLRSSIKGLYGVIKRDAKLTKHHLTRSKKAHCNLALHNFCVSQYEKQVEEKLDYEKRNENAGKIVISNALLCFERSFGARDFVALNAKEHLLHPETAATKNDSESEFFRLRNVAFDILSERTRKFFQEMVKSIAVTLDKVTIHRTSFTVLMTYFFKDGKLHVILNKLHKLGLLEYDSMGTAKMVINVLTETLGLTQTKLATILRHFVYDGVYASPQERVRGGGSLDIKYHVSQLLGLSENDITGN